MPQVTGQRQAELGHAVVCRIAGNGVGFFAIPPKGANVWVEFEGGDPDQPIWSGCFWGIGEAPAMSRGAPQVVSSRPRPAR